MFSLKTLHPCHDSNAGLLSLRLMWCPLRHASRASFKVLSYFSWKCENSGMPDLMSNGNGLRKFNQIFHFPALVQSLFRPSTKVWLSPKVFSSVDLTNLFHASWKRSKTVIKVLASDFPNWVLILEKYTHSSLSIPILVNPNWKHFFGNF
jgi:hypothetical protein